MGVLLLKRLNLLSFQMWVKQDIILIMVVDVWWVYKYDIKFHLSTSRVISSLRFGT